MKRVNILYFVSVLACLSACTEKIDVDVSEAESKLVIEASIDWEKGTQGNVQTVKLSQSTPYFDSEKHLFVEGATVSIRRDRDGEQFDFLDQHNGTYLTESFVPELNASYTLEILYQGNYYQAQERLMATPEISRLSQSIERGSDDEALEINMYFDDPITENDFYLIRLDEKDALLPRFFYLKDEITNGNEIHFFYEQSEDEEINQKHYKAGDELSIKLFAVSESYYDFMSILVSQYESDGGLFAATPIAIKGNCVNTSNEEDKPLGYFRLVQSAQKTYVFE